MLRSSRGAATTLALALLATTAWTWAALQELNRDSYFDDSFIYLAVVRNIVELHTAQIFPIAENEGLVASSPLRLLVLVPAYLFATAVHGHGPGKDVASLSFFASGVLTALLFLPFFGARLREWLAVAAVAGLLASTTNSMLQMEGALVFWGTWCLVRSLARSDGPREPSLLIAILFLTRVELGLAALLAGALHRRRCGRIARDAGTFLLIATVLAGAWILVAIALDVWPVPTTFLAKIRTGELRRFSAPFVRTLAETLALYLPLPDGKLGQRLVVGGGAALGTALLCLRPHGRLAALLLATVVATLARGPGNFAWYHENLLLGAIAAMAATAWSEPRATAYRGVIAAAAGALVVANAAVRLGRNDALPWQLTSPPSYGASLAWLGRQHVGNGRFVLDAPASAAASGLVSIPEIGIVSYFAGPRCWLFDSSGLAQAGQLPGVRHSFFARFYPAHVLRTAPEELRIVRARTGDGALFEAHYVARQPPPDGALAAAGAPWAFRAVEPK